jgi:acyl-CoA-binding protein
MQNIFSDAGASELTNVTTKDVIGGSYTLPSDVYTAIIKQAFITETSTKTKEFNLELDIDGKAYKFRRMWVMNKFGKAYKCDKETGQPELTDKGEKKPFSHYPLVNSLTSIVLGQEIPQTDIQLKLVKIYNKDAQGEVDTQVPVFVDLINKTVKVAISLNKEDKTVKNDQTGNYEPTGETFETNEIQHFFDKDSDKTQTEIKSEKPATFMQTWLDKNQGQVNDRSSKATANVKTTTASNTTQTATAAPDNVFAQAAAQGN